MSHSTAFVLIIIAVILFITEAEKLVDDLVENSDQASANFELCEDVQAVSGDLIEFKRDPYSHFGVYTGDGYVIHFYQPNGSKVNKHGRQKKVDVAGKDLCRVNNLESDAKRRGLNADDPELILERGFNKLNKEGKYDLVDNNSESFATECRYGTGFSRQAIFISSLSGVTQLKKDLVNIRNEATNNFESCHNVKPRLGDIIEFKREVFSNFGIYSGDGYVIHLNRTQVSKTYKYERQLMVRIARSDLCRVNNLEVAAKKRSLHADIDDIILQRALSKLYKQADYHWIEYNCETFATECRYGEGFSEQSSAVKKIAFIPQVLELIGRLWSS